jgi:aminoglycoside phosphotransferase (APT) family kinase protein
VLWDQSLPGMTPAERGAIYDEMNRVIAALHSVDVGALGLADYGKPGNYFERQIGRWSKQYVASETEKIEAMDRLIEWLPQHIPQTQGARVSVVHGDYRLDNLIVAKQSPVIVAVLDWELSTLGVPLADFSYHLMAWHMPHSDSAAGTASLVGHDLRALGIPSMSDYVDAYVARTGLDPRPALPVYLAYNFFRIAAILQGIIGRVRDGTATSEFAPAKAEMIRPLAEKAWEFARQA